jgi:hypothetical protein
MAWGFFKYRNNFVFMKDIQSNEPLHWRWFYPRVVAPCGYEGLVPRLASKDSIYCFPLPPFLLKHNALYIRTEIHMNLYRSMLKMEAACTSETPASTCEIWSLKAAKPLYYRFFKFFHCDTTLVFILYTFTVVCPGELIRQLGKTRWLGSGPNWIETSTNGRGVAMHLLAAAVTSTTINNYLAVRHSFVSLLWRHNDYSDYVLGRWHYVNETTDAGYYQNLMKLYNY